MSRRIPFARLLLIPCFITFLAFAAAGEPPPSFQVKDIEVIKDGSLYRLRGHIINNTGKDTEEANFDIVFLDAGKKIITEGSIIVEETMKAGETSAFFGLALKNPRGWKSVVVKY